MNLRYGWLLLFPLLLPLTCRGLTPFPAHCLEISPDGRTVAANLGGGEDVTLFDIQTRKQIRVLNTVGPGDQKARDAEGPVLTYSFVLGWVRQITFSPDGRYLGCSVISRDADVIVWDLKHPDTKPTLIKAPQRFGECWALTFSADSKQIVTYMQASPNGTDYLVAWNPETGKEIWRRDLGADKVQDVSFSPNLGAVAVTRRDGRDWYDPETGNPISEPKGSTAAASQPAPSAFNATIDGKTITVKQGRDGTMGKKLQAMDTVDAVRVVGEKFVVAEVNLGLQVWNLKEGKLLFNLGKPEPVEGHGIFGPAPEPVDGGSIFGPAPEKGAAAPSTQPAGLPKKK